jgi:hypothetical protein
MCSQSCIDWARVRFEMVLVGANREAKREDQRSLCKRNASETLILRRFYGEVHKSVGLLFETILMLTEPAGKGLVRGLGPV